ncbi:MAG: hypothetical protein GF334_13765 [Candidatus Altiarchaeales archaeon]|nr:hypothetical protein [Candidatus Altiarchaeales archaeon]
MPEIKTQIPFRVVDRKMFKGLGGGGGDTPPDGSDQDKLLKYLHAKSEQQTQALKEGRYQEALKGYAEIISLVKKHNLKLAPETKKNISNNIGYGWYRLTRFEKAGKRFKTNLKQDDKDLIAKNGYAACLVMQAKQKKEGGNQENLREAEILFTELTEQLKQDPEIPPQVQAVIENNLACTHYLLKKPEKAQETFLLASQDDPQNQVIWSNRAIYFIKTDKLEDAKWAADTSEEISQQKNDTSLNHNTATILLTKKRPTPSQLKGVLKKVMEKKSRRETEKIKAATQPTRLKVVEENQEKREPQENKKEKIQQMMKKPIKIVDKDIAVETFEQQGVNAADEIIGGGEAERMQTTLAKATANQRLEYMLGMLKKIKEKNPDEKQKNNLKKHLFQGLKVCDEQNHTDQNILLWTAEILKIIGNQEDARKLWQAHQNLDPHYKSDEAILESIKSVEQGMNV